MSNIQNTAVTLPVFFLLFYLSNYDFVSSDSNTTRLVAFIVQKVDRYIDTKTITIYPK